MVSKTKNENGSNGVLVILLVLVGLGMFGFLLFTQTYNQLVTKEELVKAEWGNVETTYARRLDLIPNLVATVKGYAKHEESIWLEFAEARKQFNEATSVEAKVESSNRLESVLSKINWVVEQYPELKANENFMALQSELASTENQINSGRQSYNDKVNDYQSYKRQFLTSLIAGNGFKDYPYFKARDGANVAPVVDFGK